MFDVEKEAVTFCKQHGLPDFYHKQAQDLTALLTRAHEAGRDAAERECIQLPRPPARLSDGPGDVQPNDHEIRAYNQAWRDYRAAIHERRRVREGEGDDS